MDIFHRLAIIACDGQKCVIRSGEEGQLVELSTGLREKATTKPSTLYPISSLLTMFKQPFLNCESRYFQQGKGPSRSSELV